MASKKLFIDRADAGRQLAEKLKKYKAEKSVVLALPRGGVEIGFEIAKRLNTLLDVLVVRKLGVPKNPEFGIGAVAEGGILVINRNDMALFGLTESELTKVIARETEELERRIALFRGNRHNPQVSGRTVILTDDGLATGATARAAVESLKPANPGKLIFAVPVCAKDASVALRGQVDELVCLYEPDNFYAVGQWYEKFPQLDDGEVINLLEQARETFPPSNY